MAGDQKEARAATGGLREATDLFLMNPDAASGWLNQADNYMQTFVQNPRTFILPKEHAFMKPVIEAYAYRLEGFVEYLLGVRDSFDRDSAAWEKMQTVYRRVMGRYTQQVRRERADRALAKATEAYGNNTNFHDRLRWVANLEHEWAKRRLDFLAERRAKTENNRLSSDERTELLAEFWDMIDTEIYNGELPPWS